MTYFQKGFLLCFYITVAKSLRACSVLSPALPYNMVGPWEILTAPHCWSWWGDRSPWNPCCLWETHGTSSESQFLGTYCHVVQSKVCPLYFLFLVTQTNNIKYRNRHTGKAAKAPWKCFSPSALAFNTGENAAQCSSLEISFHILLPWTTKEFLLPLIPSFSDPLSKGTTFL